MEVEQILKGTIDRFLYQGSDNGFVVFVLTRGNLSTIVTGSLPALQAGQEIEVHGQWIMHPKFGKQFSAKHCTVQLPTSLVGLKKYLGSGLIKGIGKVYAEKLVDAFGTTVLDIIDNEPHKLVCVEGIGPKRAEQIIHAWKTQKDIAQLMVFLQDKGISPSLATRIYKQYNHAATAIITENPYRIADEIWGVGFKTADQLAQKLGFSLNAPQRIGAGILFALKQASDQGHLYLEVNDLKERASVLLELSAENAQELSKALHTLYNTERIHLITHEDKHYLGLRSHYYAEHGVATKLKALLTRPSHLKIDCDALYQKLRCPAPGDIVLNENQQRGVLAALSNKVTIITGGPGTGKTTIIKKVLATLDEQAIRYKLAAPTGRAAKRITESTGRYAVTLHRLLEFDPGAMRFVHDERNALKLDYLIIDEASMIDIFLAHALLKALPQDAHLILIGDIDQLPSVGAGNFLNDCIASESITCVRLTEIYRQAQDSLITINAHKINRGEFPVSSLPQSRKDFIFIKEESPEQAYNHLKRIFFIELKKQGLTPHDAQVLVPMNRGLVGTHTINQQLQTLLNDTQSPALEYHGTQYKTGDRVMQIRNNYDKNVFNGDIGVIARVTAEAKELVVLFDEKEVAYETNELDELVLAYAISIHKSQGSEYPAVIVPVFTQHFALLQRNLIYTALTRAKKICFFIGQPRALAMAIKTIKGTQRTTFLRVFLKNNL